METYNVSLFCTSFGAGDAVIITIDSENKIVAVEYDYSYSTGLCWGLRPVDFKIGGDFDEELANAKLDYEDIAEKRLLLSVRQQVEEEERV